MNIVNTKNSIHARQITSIYEALDAGNFKFACNLTQKYLKKHPACIAYKALFALALVRSAKIDEAEVVLEELLKLPASRLDETIVHPLSTALKDIGKTEECARLFERCFAEHPESEEFGVQYFLALCPVKEFEKQYQLSLKLFKSSGKKKYLFWAIASLFLQHRWDASESNVKGIYLKLAGKLCEKALEMRDGIATLEELQIVIGVLEELKDFQTAFDVCNQFKYLFQFPEEFEAKQIELLRLCCRWKELHQQTFQRLSQPLQEKPHDWYYVSNFIEAAKALENENETEIKQQVLEIKSNYHHLSDKRTELLAQIEFARSFDYCLPSFEASLWGYLCAMQEKESCMRDIYSMLQRSSPEQREAFKNHVLSNRPESISDSLFIKCIHLLRFCQHSILISIEILLEANTEESILLAVIQLLEEYDAFRKGENLNSAFVLLKELVQKKPLNFVYKIYLMIIAQQIGLFSFAFRLFEDLSIKNIQLDSLCFLAAENASDFGHFDIATQLFHRAFCLYYTNRKECAEAVSYCFRNASYAKLIDFYGLSNTLENSLQWLLMEGEMLVIEPLLTVKRPQDLPKYYTLNESHSEKIVLSPREISLMSDNRDLTVLEFESGKRFKFVDQLFARKGSNVAQLYSLFQLLCKRLESKEIELLEKVMESYSALQLGTDPLYQPLFKFVAELFQEHIACLKEQDPIQKVEWKSLQKLKDQITQFQWTESFSSVENRIRTTQFVIACCFSCLSFALHPEKTAQVNEGISMAKDVNLVLVQKLKSFAEFHAEPQQHPGSGLQEWKLISPLAQREFSLEARKELELEFKQEKQKVSSALIALLNQKASLLK